MLLSEGAVAPGFFNLVPWVVFFPVIGLLLNILIGKRVGERGIGLIAIAASGLTFIVSLLLMVSLQGNGHAAVSVPLLDWITVGEFHLPWQFRVDTLSVTMMLVVSGVGTLIHIYAAGYMHFDVRYKEDVDSYQRFFVYLNLFIAAMMILVTGDNYLMLFVGWEGVGLCSYLLIGFWFNRSPDASFGTGNAFAAKKAFIANRVGDFGFLMAMFLTFWTFGSLAFDEVFKAVEHTPPADGVIWAISLFMLLGVTGKSAQIPLFVWLPDAMAGPTPVSALIHAATMVTAGVYLIVRSAPIFSALPEVQNVVALVGGATALFAATIAVGQYDIKKVLAYSTISQLGFMVAAVGMGAYVAGMFHLVTHAFFKALLFLGSGSVILAVERGHHPLEEDGGGHSDHNDEHSEHFDPQDMRNMGGLRDKLPWTYWTYLMGTLALAGIPIWAGFWSKDEILADALIENPTVYWLLVAAAFFTAFYMGRQIWLVFFGEARSPAAEKAKESPATMTYPLLVLAALSVVGGFMNLPGLHQFGHWLGYTLEESLGHELHFIDFNPTVALTSTLLALSAIYISWLIYGKSPLKKGQKDPLQKTLGAVFTGMHNKWYVDEIYDFLILRPYQRLASFLADTLDWKIWHDWFHEKGIRDGFRAITRFLADPVDLGVIDGIANGLARFAQGSASGLSLLQTGIVRNYALSVFLGVVIILGYLVFQ